MEKDEWTEQSGMREGTRDRTGKKINAHSTRICFQTQNNRELIKEKLGSISQGFLSQLSNSFWCCLDVKLNSQNLSSKKSMAVSEENWFFETVNEELNLPAMHDGVMVS